MSKLIESLLGDMRSVFGESFGSSIEPVVSLSEAVEYDLTEKRKDMPGRGGGDRMRFGKGAGHVPPGKKNSGVGQKTKKMLRGQEAAAKKNMDDFHAHASAEGEKSSKAAKERASARASKDDDDEGGRAAPKNASSGGGGSGGRHYPFKRHSNLGLGPGTPPVPVAFKRGPVHHDEAKCWKCKCGPIYTAGCICHGTGASKDCKKGETKHVKIREDYHQAYNTMYHAHRASHSTAVTRAGKR